MTDEGPSTSSPQPEHGAPGRPSLPALSDKKLKKLKEREAKKGVVYLSRIPPHLKPQKLRHMLEEYGELGRLYLAPEDPSLRRKRKKQGGNSGKNFTEGWVEFEDKKRAKEVAAHLNGQPMGGKRRSAHFYDLWCLKYLSGFKWDHLTEEIAYQNAVRERRLEAEISAAKRERDFYLSRVDQAKAVSAITERKQKRADAAAGGSEAGGSGASGGAAAAPQQQQQQQGAAEGSRPRVVRAYGQRQAKADPVSDAGAPRLSEGLLQLLAGKKARRQ